MAVGLGGRDVTVWCGGWLAGEVQIRHDTRIWFKNNQLITKGDNYRGFYAYKSPNLLIDGLRHGQPRLAYGIYFKRL